LPALESATSACTTQSPVHGHREDCRCLTCITRRTYNLLVREGSGAGCDGVPVILLGRNAVMEPSAKLSTHSRSADTLAWLGEACSDISPPPRPRRVSATRIPPMRTPVPEPQPPPQLPAGGGSVANAWRGAGRAGCPRCGRDFVGRALIMHLKSCQGRSHHLCNSSREGSEPTHPPSSQLSVTKSTSSSMGKSICEVAVPLDSSNLEPCHHCGRTFRPEALQRHAQICRKVFMGRRPTFDSAARALPPEAAFAKRTSAWNYDKDVGSAAEVPKWRQQSAFLRASLRQARAIARQQKERTHGELPHPAPSPSPVPDSRVLCPRCNRRFAKQQSARHMQHCRGGGAAIRW